MWTSKNPQSKSRFEKSKIDEQEPRNAEEPTTNGVNPPVESNHAGGEDEEDASTTVINPHQQSKAPPKKRTRTKPARPARKLDRMPPWKVILHNDDVNDMGYVVETLMVLTPHSFETAYRCMLEAHLRGHSLVLMTHQERAELYRDQFGSRLLTVTIEPDESE